MTTATLNPPTIAPPLAALRRVLLISYHFPPVGGAGVQRPVKFVKYLREYGWEPAVLVASNPSVPVRDESLCADIPEGVQIVRARTFEPSYAVKQQVATPPAQNYGIRAALRSCARGVAKTFLQPEAQVLWLPAAYRAACRLMSAQRFDAILATAPPYSNLLLGTLLKRRFGTPLVADFRDEWDLSSQYLENSQKDWFSNALQSRMQRWVLRNADAIVATTQLSTERIAERAQLAGGSVRSACIYNGYDETDFPQAIPAESDPATSSRPFRLVYTGTLWNLTCVAPLLRAVQFLSETRPQLMPLLELVFVGRKTPPQVALLDQLAQTGCTLRNIDYCDHHDAVALMQSAGGLCLLLSDVPGADRVAPAKVFEYFAADRPLLAIAPEGETARLVRSVDPAAHFLPADTTGIAGWIEARLLASNSFSQRPGREFVQCFSRRHLTGQLASLLSDVVAVAETAPGESRGGRR